MYFSQIDAIKYLAKHGVYGNEWQGAGLWEAVLAILKHQNISEPTLKKLLAKAESF